MSSLDSDQTTAPSLWEALAAFPAGNTQAIDRAHALLVAGLVTAKKPEVVLELGVGSAYLTGVLLAALRENGRGRLVSVDNFFDWKGAEPPHIGVLRQRAAHWTLVKAEEGAFLRATAAESFDLIVSDGDHTRGYQNAPDVFRVCRREGVLVFHDTNCPLFRLLQRLPRRCRQLNFSAHHFTAPGLPGERTERGLLVVANDGAKRFTLDWVTWAYLVWRDRVRPVLRGGRSA